MTSPKTSRDYAKSLRDAADFLDSRPEFLYDTNLYLFVNCYSKETFLAAVHALKPGKKEFTDGPYPELQFTPELPAKSFSIRVDVPRDKVCRKVRDAQWECEPILSDAEVASI